MTKLGWHIFLNVCGSVILRAVETRFVNTPSLIQNTDTNFRALRQHLGSHINTNFAVYLISSSLCNVSLVPNYNLYLKFTKFYFCVSVHRRINQIKHQLRATLCRFYFCRVTLHVSGVKRPSSGVLKIWHGGPWYRCYSCR